MKTVFLLTSQQHTCSDNPIGSYHSLISGLKLNNVKIKTTGTCNLLGPEDETITENEIVKTGKEADLIILFFVNIPQTEKCGDFHKEPYLSKALKIDRWEHTIFIDYYEYTWRNKLESYQPSYHTKLIFKCQKYFKREYTLWHKKWFYNMKPYPLSYFPLNKISFPEKKYDIFCSFPQMETGLRYHVVKLCEKLQRDFTIIIKHDCTKEEYISFIQASWITLDGKGAGYINNRFLEIIANRSLCVREKYQVEFYKDYTNEMIQEYNTIDELEILLVNLLSNKNKIKGMENMAYEHYKSYHTSDKVVKYLLEESLDTINLI